MISIYNYKFPSEQCCTVQICCVFNIVHFKIFSSLFMISSLTHGSLRSMLHNIFKWGDFLDVLLLLISNWTPVWSEHTLYDFNIFSSFETTSGPSRCSVWAAVPCALPSPFCQFGSQHSWMSARLSCLVMFIFAVSWWVLKMCLL